MSETVDGSEGSAKKKGGGKLLLIGLLAALLLGGSSFFAVYSGMVSVPFLSADKGGKGSEEMAGDGKGGETVPDSHLPKPGEAAFVALEPLILSLGPESRSSHLKITLYLEVAPGSEGEVEANKPRILDVLNTFLRAIDEREFEMPRAMARMRAQMLRRVQLVAPEGTVRDLLVQEFLLN
ncbi:MAG: flagellar basal body-associated FliL family protein [Pseudomonadota bacterium]